MRIMLLTPPVLYARHISPGPAYIKAYLERAGHEVRCRDLNTEIHVQNDGDDFYWTHQIIAESCILLTSHFLKNG